MKPRPVHEILAGLERSEPFAKIATLQSHIFLEKKRSLRRQIFEEALKSFRTQLLERRDRGGPQHRS